MSFYPMLPIVLYFLIVFRATSIDPVVIQTSSNHTNVPIHLHFDNINGYEMASIKGGEAIDLTYIKNLITDDEARQLVTICDHRNGWVMSPQKDVDNGIGDFHKNDARSSSSCPLIWPMLYLPRYDELKEAGKMTEELEKELNFTWLLTRKFASLFEISADRFEPFQLVRYEIGQQYKLHHDHGDYYGLSDAHRSTTLLIFLSNVENAGGETSFPALNITVEPRQGSGIVWNNIRNIDDSNVVQNADGGVEFNNRILLEAVHEGLPLRSRAYDDEITIKYAMNVWIRENEIINLDKEAYKT